MKPIYIFSVSGFGREVYATTKKLNFTVAAFIEKDPQSTDANYQGIPILCEDDLRLQSKDAIQAAAVAVGDSKLREKIVNNIKVKWPECEFPNIIDPTCIIYNPDTVKLGIGLVMMPFCLITTDIKIGDFSQFGVGTGIGHDSIIDDYVTTGMNVQIAGRTKIGKRTRLGSSVTTIDGGISICDDTIIGAGSVVIKNIVEPGVYVGAPTRKIK